MKIKLYPAICDTEGVDYMARGWNTDPRPGNWKDDGKFCFDPYVFEMSGGTMFFGNTSHGQALLKFWQKETKRYPGKADDRILTLAIMRNSLLTELSTIQLPIEYLWLDLDYDDYLTEGEDYKKKMISISHPECLTGEDRASAEGAASDRYPRGYDRATDALLNCDWDEFYEYIYFDEKGKMGPFKHYFEWLESKGVIDLYPYAKKYGKTYNPIAKKNHKLMGDVTANIADKTVVVSKQAFGTPSLHKVEDDRMIIPTILKYLEKGQGVIYIPGKPTSVRWVVERVNKHQLDFVTRNKNKNKGRGKKEYLLELDPTYPIYFGPNNKVLRHMLYMSESFAGMQKVFNRSFIFLTRIHCGWI
jgi:hypothetical protein